MNEPSLRFSTFDVTDPDEAELLGRYKGALATIDAAEDDTSRIAGLDQWDQLRRGFFTWRSLVNLRFQQDTRDEARRERRELADKLVAEVSLIDADVKRALVGRTDAATLEERAGGQAIACWRADMEAYAPELKDDLVAESGIVADYVALLGAAKIPFRGETYNFPAMVPFAKDADRSTRHDAMRATSGWFAENREALDGFYDKLVKLRAGMAKKVGLDSFVELGYRRMHRVDYDRHDVERFRNEVRRVVVPLATEMRAKQADDIGLETLMLWDEDTHDARGNPKPIGGTDELIERGQQAFRAAHPEIGDFFDGMVKHELLDLTLRDGKAGGGFCTFFPDLDSPFIFANCNGTQDDVRVLVHEAGHAFQMWSSRKHNLIEKLHPTYEACEIHSMALEFLVWPQMESFFGEDADRYRRIHLADALTFLPYGVAVDHFQHLVYDTPDATPEERHAMWQEMERMYLPWRQYGDLAHYGDGGLWQRQRHIYGMPFYYIDYTLAQTCALQFWARAFEDREGAYADYVALCRRGGTAPFQALAKSAGLISPFEPGCLEDVVNRARTWLAESAT